MKMKLTVAVLVLSLSTQAFAAGTVKSCAEVYQDKVTRVEFYDSLRSAIGVYGLVGLIPIFTPMGAVVLVGTGVLLNVTGMGKNFINKKFRVMMPDAYYESILIDAVTHPDSDLVIEGDTGYNYFGKAVAHRYLVSASEKQNLLSQMVQAFQARAIAEKNDTKISSITIESVSQQMTKMLESKELCEKTNIFGTTKIRPVKLKKFKNRIYNAL